MVGAAIAGAAVGGFANYMSTQSANKASAREAQKDRDFQERMSKSQYQNMVADLEKAGLNKALAYSNSPGKVSGSTASQSAAQFDSPDFVGALTKRAQRDLADAQVQSAIAQAELTKDNSAKVKAETASLLAKLPEELQVLRSTTARNNADSLGNPIKLGLGAGNLVLDHIPDIQRGLTSAWDTYQQKIVDPYVRQPMNKAIDSFRSFYNRVKEPPMKNSKRLDVKKAFSENPNPRFNVKRRKK